MKYTQVSGRRYFSRCPTRKARCENFPLVPDMGTLKAANWTSMNDIRRVSPKAKVLNRDRARFEVAGGNYRLIASFDFRWQIVFVKFIGTHAEYDAIDPLTVARF
jgi:mRNA interferase HigB